MNIVPFVHEGLGNSSYLVGLDDGTALLVDPDRSIQRYLDQARAMEWRIKAVFETHLHADFVSGAHEVAAATGARLFLPREAHVRLPHEPVDAGRLITLSGTEIEAIGSPGHTPEHISYTIRTNAHPAALFTGGSLIVGGAARTDLISDEMTDELTRAQFRTLANAFKSMPDETELYPTHGGGSFCSAGSGSSRTSTLGLERATNPMLNFENEDKFAAWFPTTFPAAPAYYFRMRAFNAVGPRLRRDIPMPPPMEPDQFAAAANTALIVDTRSVEAYSTAHIRGSLHIQFRDSFAVWLGWLVPAGTRLLFVAEPARLDDIITEALLVGYEDLGGWLGGGVDAWRRSGHPVSSTEFVDGDTALTYVADGADLIDVRETNEYVQRHAPNARHIALGTLDQRSLAGTEEDRVVVYCGHGERSSTAASLLERAGRTHVVNVRGGLDTLLASEKGASR
jgi:glyoxylase-like metal-dependent hydrolase (beta-lactamase superfamily II)